MASWYHEGTVTIAADAVAVTGTGTQWREHVAAGEALVGPDGRTYEISSVLSDTALTIARPYAGGAVADGSYSIQPTGQPVRDLTAAVRALLDGMRETRDGVGAGLIEPGSPALPGLRLRDEQASGLAGTGDGAMALVVDNVPMVSATRRGLVLGAVASAAAAALPAGAEAEAGIGYLADEDSYYFREPVSGRLQRHIMRLYLEDVGVVPGEAGNAVANAAAWNLATSPTGANLRPQPRPGGHYRIGSAITLREGQVLASEGRPATIYMTTDFSNATSAGRYEVNAVGFRSVSSTQRKGIRMENLVIQSDPAQGRNLRAIFLRNCADFHIRGVEIFGLPMGVGIAIASADGDWSIDDCRIHDFYDDTVWAEPPQMTAIEIDNDLHNGRCSYGGRIRGAYIKDLRVGPTLEAQWGDQSDGINVLKPGTKALTISDYTIENVGEGIDFFGSDGMIGQGRLDQCRYFGLKLIHGASRNVVRGPITISRYGLVGLQLATGKNGGSGGDVVGNMISGITCTNANEDGAKLANTTSACQITADRRPGSPGWADGELPEQVRGNTITGCRFEVGENGDFAINDESGEQSLGNNSLPNIFDGVTLVRKSQGDGPVYRNLYGGSRLRRAGSATIETSSAQ